MRCSETVSQGQPRLADEGINMSSTTGAQGREAKEPCSLPKLTGRAPG
jgi:hypothetical protein